MKFVTGPTSWGKRLLCWPGGRYVALVLLPVLASSPPGALAEEQVVQIHGRVVDAAGNSVEGASILIGNWYTQFEEGDASRPQAGSTQSDGTFSVTLKPRSVFGWKHENPLLRIWAEDRTRRSPERVLRIQAETGALSAPPLVLEDLGVAQVRLTYLDGRPAADADVVVHFRDPSLRFNDNPTARYHRRVSTNSVGIAVLEGVLRRSYRTVALGARVAALARQWFHIEHVALAHDIGGMLLLEASLERGATVAGTVGSGDDSAVVRYEVAAVRPEGSSYLSELTWHPVDDNGGFTLRDCVLSRSDLWVSAVGSARPGEDRPADRLPLLVLPLDQRKPTIDTPLDVGSLRVPALGTLMLEIWRHGHLLESGSLDIQRADYRGGGGPIVRIVNGRVEVPRVPAEGKFLVRVHSSDGSAGVDSAHQGGAFTVQGTKGVHLLNLDSQ